MTIVVFYKNHIARRRGMVGNRLEGKKPVGKDNSFDSWQGAEVRAGAGGGEWSPPQPRISWRKSNLHLEGSRQPLAPSLHPSPKLGAERHGQQIVSKTNRPESLAKTPTSVQSNFTYNSFFF